MTNIKLTTIGAVLALSVGAVLVGCTPQVAEPTPKPSTSAPVATDAPAQEHEVGTAVDPETKLVEGQTAYKLADGSYVVIQADKPFPESVMADINAKAEAVVDANTTNDLKNREAYGGAEVLANSIVRSTGKHVLVATQIYSYSVSESPSAISYRWILVGADASEYTVNASKEQILADAEAIIQNKPNPAEWMVVVA